MRKRFTVIVSSHKAAVTFKANSISVMFPVLVVNNTKSPSWKYVRDIGPDPNVQAAQALGDYGKAQPLVDVDSQDFVCNRDVNAGPKTQIATVIAGDEVAFKVSLGYPGLDATFFHEGPGMVYMSRAPAPNDDLVNYKGNGDWFKIAYAGPSSDTTWSLFNKESMKFTIPRTTPPGKYLLRMEQIYPHDIPGQTQFYVSCAHIDVIGPGGGTPTNFIKFPGGYNLSHPGILVTENQWKSKDLLSYKPPGPPVWQG